MRNKAAHIQPNKAEKRLKCFRYTVHTISALNIYLYTKMGVFYIQLLSVNGYDVNSPVKVIIEAINTAVYLQQEFC